MYLKGSKWSMKRRTRRSSSPFRIALLLVLIAGALYLDRVIVPKVPAMWTPTATPTVNPESFLNEARQFFAEGKMIQAIASYKQAIIANPTDQSLFIELARAQVWTADYQGALESAERSLVGNDDYATGHAVRGWVLNFMGEYVDAEIALQKALDMDPNNPYIHAYMAEMLIDKGDAIDVEKASAESRKGMDLNPNLLETIRARGYVLLNTGNYEEALALYQRAIEINRYIPDLYLNEGYCYKFLIDRDSENANRAADAFLQANSLNPKSAIPDLELSRLYLSLGEYERAIQYAENAVKDEPTNGLRYGNLGIMFYKNDKYNQAIDALAVAIQGGTTDDGEQIQALTLDYPTATYYVYYGLSLAMVTPNQCARAVPVFQALLNSVPDDPTAFENAEYGLEICSSAPEETGQSQETQATEEATEEP